MPHRDCDIAPRWFAELKMRNEAVGSPTTQPSITTATISTGPFPGNVAAITRSQQKATEEPLKEREHAKPFSPDQWTYNRHLRDKMIEDVVKAQSSETLPGTKTWNHRSGIPEQSAVASLDELPHWIHLMTTTPCPLFPKGPRLSKPPHRSFVITFWTKLSSLRSDNFSNTLQLSDQPWPAILQTIRSQSQPNPPLILPQHPSPLLSPWIGKCRSSKSPSGRPSWIMYSSTADPVST